MTPFRERNPVVIGFVSLLALGLVLTAALRADDLPLIGGGDTYRAAFTESGGLKQGDEVRIAGVRVGKVDEVALDDGLVVATFKVDSDEAFGPDTRADPYRPPNRVSWTKPWYRGSAFERGRITDAPFAV